MKVNLDNYPPNPEFSKRLEDLLAGESQLDVTTAGRILRRTDGSLVLYHNGSEMGLETQNGLGNLSIGDVVKVRGDYIQADNQKRFVARKITLCSKCINPLPDEVKSESTGAINLLVNPDKRETILLRSKILKTIRSFLDTNGFVEVETPILQYYPDSAPVSTFKTEYNGKGHEYHLRICPEEFLKRLTFGFDRIYEIAKCFRNSDRSKKHNPEFTMLEFYAAFTTFEDTMVLTEQLVEKVALETKGTTKLKFKGYEIDVKPPWKRIAVQDAARENYGFDLLNASGEDLRKVLGVDEDLPRETLLTKFIEDKLEGLFIQPTFLTYYPIGVGVPDKPSRAYPGTMERCEAFVARDFELANLGSINNDPLFLDRHNRNNLVNKFGKDNVERYLDKDFLYEVGFGLPPLACSGIGIDRLVMLLANKEDIKDTIAYPFKVGEK